MVEASVCVVVPGRSQTLFHCLFQLHYHSISITGGAHMRCVDSWILDTVTLHVWDLPLTKVLCCSASNVVMWSKYTTENCSISATWGNAKLILYWRKSTSVTERSLVLCCLQKADLSDYNLYSLGLEGKVVGSQLYTLLILLLSNFHWSKQLLLPAKSQWSIEVVRNNMTYI